MNRTEKQEFVANLCTTLNSSQLVIITNQTGLSVEESTDLRIKMRTAGAGYKVVKNSLAQIAVRETGMDSLESYLKGPTALAYSQDPVSAAKVTVEFMALNPKLTVIAGILAGKFLDHERIKALAKLPSIEVLRSKLLGVIMAPATKLACVVKEPSASLTRVISSYSKQ